MQRIRSQQFSGYLMYVICLPLLTAGCSNSSTPASEEIDLGKISDSIYHNEYFDMDFSIPEKWHVLDEAEKQHLKDTGRAVLKNKGKNMEAKLKLSELRTVTLCSIFKHPLGTPVDFNPSMIMMAEKISFGQGISDGKDYLQHTKKMEEKLALNISYPEEITSKTIAGREFGEMSSVIDYDVVEITQLKFTTIMKGYALTFIVSYNNEEDKALVKDIIKSIHFN
ncbi:MAG: hypothetical protein COA78_31195 [Blastopirellula sp.]|nr:MAG: hypothetical protein COA78_31195 [Blastopirellula sp.]